jgi:hypothetical protein
VVLLSRVVAALAYAGAAFLFGIALGERGELGAVQYAFQYIIPLATLALAVVSRQGRPEVLLTGIVLLAGLRIGQLAFARAFEECLSQGATVRAAIVQHHARIGDYPLRLDELQMELPCDCVFRKTILHYFANDRGFRLWISNDAKTHEFGSRVIPSAVEGSSHVHDGRSFGRLRGSG